MDMPLLPLRAATTLVASSGSDVPIATTVSPTTASLMPSSVATAVAPPTKRLEPPIRQPRPMMINRPARSHDIGAWASAASSEVGCVGSSEAACLSAFLADNPACSVTYMKKPNNASNTSASMRESVPSRHISTSSIEATRANGMSLRTVWRSMVIGATRAVTPTISSALNTLLPTTLPTARSAVPLRADTRLTQNSGIEVPIATIVRPITI